MKAKEIIEKAIETFDPIHVLIMVSGGHDSLTNAHVSAQALQDLGWGFEVYHGDTGIKVMQTQEHVKMVCEMYGWPLVIRSPKPPYDYATQVERAGGFPGPAQHPYMMRNLKEKPLRKYVSHKIKSKPHARDNVLLLTGARKHESKIRLNYNDVMRKDGSRIWTNPIFYWSEEDCDTYMKENEIPRNPVKEKLCISGECLCGAFAAPEERAELKASYPEDYERDIAPLEPISPHPWGSKPKKKDPAQLDFGPMCVGCASKWNPND